MEPTNILVIKHGALGDIVLATTAFAAIRANHRQARITLLTTRAYAELLAQSPYFDEVWIDSKPKWYQFGELLALRRMLNSKQWEWIYDIQTSSRTRRYPYLLRKPWPKISGATPGISHPRPAYDTTKHALENLRTQLALTGIDIGDMPGISWLKADISQLLSIIGATANSPPEGESNPFTDLVGGNINASMRGEPPPRMSQGTSRSPSGGELKSGALATSYALLVPGGAAHRPGKRWPAEQYAQLAQMLVARNITPVLIGTSAEAAAMEFIASHVPTAINLCGKTTIPQLAELARGATFAVGNDTGPMHLIAATGCASAVLFSHASDPIRSRPIGRHVVIFREADLSKLPPEHVFTGLTEAL